MNRHEDHAPWHFAAATQTRRHRTQRVETRTNSLHGTPGQQGVLRMHIDEGLGAYGIQSRRFTGARHGVHDREYDQCSYQMDIHRWLACLGAIGLGGYERALPPRRKLVVA